MKLKKALSVLVAAAMMLTVVSLSFSAFAESASAQQVVSAIDALPEDYQLPVADQNAVIDALGAYESLSEDQKAQVTNIDKLNKDIASLNGLSDIWVIYNGNGGVTEYGDNSFPVETKGQDYVAGNNIFYNNGYEFLHWSTDLADGLNFVTGKEFSPVSTLAQLISRDGGAEENAYKYYYFAYANAEDLKADLAEASDPADPFGTNAGARAISRDENGNPVKVWQINLYAIWDNVEKTPVTNVFVSNYPENVGGEHSEKYITAYEGYNGHTIYNPFEQIAIPDTDKVCVFKAWADENGNEFAEGEQYTDPVEGVTAGKTFYATWKEETKAVVTYNSNNPNGESAQYIDNENDHFVGEQYKTMTWANLERKGEGFVKPDDYKFAGWNTAADGSGTAYAANRPLTLEGDLVLYAQWSQVANFTYNSNYPGDDAEQKTFVRTWDTGTTKNIDKLEDIKSFATPEGYAFMGWNTAADGSGDSYEPGAEIKVTQSLNLYARWEELSAYTITYNSNDKANLSVTRKVYGKAGIDIKSNTIVLQNADYKNIAGLLSWNTKADGTGESYEAGAEFTIIGDQTFYAQWDKAAHDMEFTFIDLPEKAEVNADSVETIRAARKTYDALPAESQGRVRSYKRLVDAESYCAPHDIWVLYDGNGGTIESDGSHSTRKILSDIYQVNDSFTSSPNIFSYINPNNGLEFPFLYWCTDITGGYTFGTEKTVDIKSVLGKYVDDPTADGRDIFFDYVYASIEDQKADRLDAQVNDTANTGARSVYKNAAGEGIKVWQIGLYAIWDNISKEYLTNTYHPNFPESIKNLEPESVTDEVIMGDSAFTLENVFEDVTSTLGIELAGWCVDPEGNDEIFDPGMEYTDPVDGATAAMNFYAQWEPVEVEFTITYDSNDEYGDTYDEFISEYGPVPIEAEVIGCPIDFTNDSYFYSWNTEPDGSGETYEEGDLIRLTEDVTLYAQWDGDEEFDDVDTGDSTMVAGAIAVAAAAAGLFVVFKKKK